MKFANTFSNISIAAILATSTIMPTAQSQAEEPKWDFEYGFKHLNEVGADKYVVENKNLRKYTEWQNPPITYLGPKSNDVDCSLTRKFTFDRPTSAARLKVNLATYNFGGGRVGKASCWASVDGKDWKLVLDNPTPSRIDSYQGFDDDLPNELTGSKELWVQMRLHVSKAPNSSYTLAQFGRSTANAKSNVFEIKTSLESVEKTEPISMAEKPIEPPAPPNLTPPSPSNRDNPKESLPSKPDLEPAHKATAPKPTPKVMNLTDALVAWYPLDGNAKDHSGFGNHGKIHGAKPAMDHQGNSGKAYQFDGKDDHIIIKHSDSLNPKDQITISAWIKFDDFTNDWSPIIHKGGSKMSGCSNREYSLWLNNRSYIHFTSAGNNSSQKTYDYNTPKGTWFHYAVSLDRKNHKVNIYLDGKKTLERSDSYSDFNNNRHDLLIGATEEKDYSYSNFKGSLDEIRIYTRALSQSEIQSVLKAKAQPVDLTAGLLAHYPYTGNANDHSGNEHHLEVNGSTPTEDRFGMPNSAYAFDGQDDSMFADIDERKGDFSLSLWAKADDVEQSRYRSVINVFDKTPGSKDTCQIHTSGGRYPTYQFFSSNPESFAPVTTEWQHLAVTVSGKFIRFYENGHRVYSQELEGGEANKFSNIIIGRNRQGRAKYHGAIDDVYVYGRAITGAEVERLFNGGFEDSDGDGLTDDYEKGYGRYQLIKGSYDWKKAKEDAEKRGGHLATITSQAEWEAVREVVGELPSTYWLGGTDEKTEGTWEWITGELWKFTKWSSNEPNNLGNEDYLQTWGKSIDGNRLWNDNQFNENRNGYILEYGYYTDPTLADSDGDRVNDGVEVAAKTDPNNPLSRPAPDRDAPGAPPSAPPGPDYVKKIDELTKDNVAKAARIEDLETAEKAHLATIADLNATNASLTATVQTQKETIAKLNAENADLKQQLNNTRQEVVNVSYELSETKEQLQAAIDVARTPFVNGWVYDPEQGWLFTDADHYPLVYSQATQSWHYYELGTAAPRFFYSYKTQEWEAWDPMPEQTETAVASSQSATTNQNL